MRGGLNSLAELGDLSIDLPDGRAFLLRGGHRLWAAPEVPEITYEPDNEPVSVERAAECITATQTAPATLAIGKSIEVSLVDGGVSLNHRLTNQGTVPIDVAPWSITQLPVGGTAIIPLRLEPADPNRLQPNSSVVVWPYTGVADDPYSTENRLLIVGGSRTSATKLGTSLDRGWLAYVRDGLVFVKRATHHPGGRYLDLGASGQCYAGPHFVELETLGQQTVLAPGESTTHRETWELHNVPTDTPPGLIPELLNLDRNRLVTKAQ